jgi:hypothetical protein
MPVCIYTFLLIHYYLRVTVRSGFKNIKQILKKESYASVLFSLKEEVVVEFNS